ncbi:MAG: hypothetical protein AAF490_09415 [Chloroflexota bacterium]
MDTISKNPIFVFILLTISIIFSISCNSTPPSDSSPTPIPATPVEDNGSGDSGGYPPANGGYPEAALDGSGYVGQTANPDLLDAPPSPEFDAPSPASGGAVTGILVREFVGEGYMPLTPGGLFLGRIVYDSNGEPALFRRGDDAPQAQILQTGVFIFNNVPPDSYAVIIDVGFAQFPLVDENNEQIVVTVTEGEVINLEQIFVDLPE